MSEKEKTILKKIRELTTKLRDNAARNNFDSYHNLANQALAYLDTLLL